MTRLWNTAVYYAQQRGFCWLLKLSRDLLAISSPAISSDLAYSILHSSQAYCNSYKVTENNLSLCCKGYAELHWCQKNRKTTVFSVTPLHRPTIWHFLNLRVHFCAFHFLLMPFVSSRLHVTQIEAPTFTNYLLSENLLIKNVIGYSRQPWIHEAVHSCCV